MPIADLGCPFPSALPPGVPRLQIARTLERCGSPSGALRLASYTGVDVAAPALSLAEGYLAFLQPACPVTLIEVGGWMRSGPWVDGCIVEGILCNCCPSTIHLQPLAALLITVPPFAVHCLAGGSPPQLPCCACLPTCRCSPSAPPCCPACPPALQGDMKEFVSSCPAGQYDLVFASFAVHHLSLEGKAEFAAQVGG